MKHCILILMILTSTSSVAQVMFRNDIALGKHQHARNRGISFIMISIGQQNPAMFASGRGGRTLIIDVQALRNPGKTYTYTALAERVYGVMPGAYPSMQTIPKYLLMEPPVIMPHAYPAIKVPRSQFYPER